MAARVIAARRRRRCWSGRRAVPARSASSRAAMSSSSRGASSGRAPTAATTAEAVSDALRRAVRRTALEASGLGRTGHPRDQGGTAWIQAARPEILPVAARGRFALIESTLTDVEAREEALRCVQCTTFCDKCVEVCPNRANYTFIIEPVRWMLPLLIVERGSHRRGTRGVPRRAGPADSARGRLLQRVRQLPDILRAPRPSVQWTSRACSSTRRGSRAEADNAFRIEGAAVRRRDGGVESRLTVAGVERTFDDGVVRVTLDADWRLGTAKVLAPWTGERSLRPAAMAVSTSVAGPLRPVAAGRVAGIFESVSLATASPVADRRRGRDM